MYYLIVGATCAGKDKIANYIVDNFKNYKMLTSTTSRPIRPGEKDGVEYHFISSDEFIKRINNNEFIEYRVYETTVNGIKDTWYYGLEKKNASDTHTNYIVVIDYKGAVEFQDYVGRENTQLVYVQSKYLDRYVRNILRGDFNLQEWLRRNKADAKWLKDAYNNSDIIIRNFGFHYPVNPIKGNNSMMFVDIFDEDEEGPCDFSLTENQIRDMIKNKSK